MDSPGEDAIILLDQIAIVGGIPVLIGGTSDGGNSCDGSPFVLSFPTGAPPRFDGPIDSCSKVTIEIKSDRVDFSAANDTRDGLDR